MGTTVSFYYIKLTGAVPIIINHSLLVGLRGHDFGVTPYMHYFRVVPIHEFSFLSSVPYIVNYNRCEFTSHTCVSRPE
eukprot:COSAG02_NODE_1119_length_14467_cov_20.454691_5_plen_78_part_00